MDNKGILVLLPTYNEEQNIGYLVDQLNSRGYDWVLCDGFSTDNTVEIAKSMGAKVIMRSGFGKGYAVCDGLEYACSHGYEGLLLIDCDQTYAVSDIPKLIHYFEDHDMVVGVRNIKEMEAPRKWANMCMNLAINLLFNAKAGDMASGLRLLRVDKFNGLIKAKSFDVEPEMYCTAIGKGYRIKQVAISYHKRVGDSKVKLYHMVMALWKIITERIKYL